MRAEGRIDVNVGPGEGQAVRMPGQQLYTRKVGGGQTGGAFSLFEVEVGPGGGDGPHLQHREDECFYVLEGRFEFVVEDAGVEAVPGDLVYASRGELHSFEKYSIETVRTDGTGRKYVTTGYAPNWFPDGEKMTFHRSPDGGDSAIYTADAGGMDEEPLTGNGTDFDADPAYAPGGGRIVFSSNRDGDYDLYIMDADGTDVRQLTNAPGSDVAPDWRPVQ